MDASISVYSKILVYDWSFEIVIYIVGLFCPFVLSLPLFVHPSSFTIIALTRRIHSIASLRSPD